jgi:uncharacterized protein (TIGR02246 family)
MHKQIALLVVAFVGVGSALVAQKSEADVKALTQQYEQAFNKGDAKAVAALYATDAFRLDPQGMFHAGREAIQKHYVTGFEGPMKGTKLSLRPGRTQNLPGDVILAEGSYQLTGAAEGPPSGRYLNTLVRQDGQWRLASVAVVPDTTKMAKPAGAPKP